MISVTTIQLPLQLESSCRQYANEWAHCLIDGYVQQAVSWTWLPGDSMLTSGLASGSPCGGPLKSPGEFQVARRSQCTARVEIHSCRDQQRLHRRKRCWSCILKATGRARLSERELGSSPGLPVFLLCCVAVLERAGSLHKCSPLHQVRQ